MKDQVIEDKDIDGLVYFSEQSFHFLAGNGEVLVDHLFEVGPFLDVRIDVLRDYMSNMFQCHDVVSPFILLVKTNAALGLANGRLVGTSQAVSELDGWVIMNFAENLFVFGVPHQHLNNRKFNLIFNNNVNLIQNRG